jgi:N-acetylglucosaminyldiphosphoundecaprenol N-acetyl-beta-D-mannosaminyltransferase
VNRAPPLLQRSGLEWAWRVKEEPKLWRRYFSDGLALLRLLATQILPYAFWLRLNRTRAAAPLHAELGSKGEAVALVLTGACGATNSEQLLAAVDEALAAAGDDGIGTDFGADIALDMRGVTYLDPRALGILLMLEARLLRSENVLLITDLAPDLHKVLRWNGMYQLFRARKQP